MPLLNLEKERARYALRKVREAQKDKEVKKHLKQYRSYVEGLPALIHNSGLTGAMAFIKAKSKDKGKEKAYQLIYFTIAEWLSDDKLQLMTLKNQKNLVEKLIKVNSRTTRLLTRESLNLISWLKKIAKAEIEQNSEG